MSNSEHTPLVRQLQAFGWTADTVDALPDLLDRETCNRLAALKPQDPDAYLLLLICARAQEYVDEAFKVVAKLVPQFRDDFAENRSSVGLRDTAYLRLAEGIHELQQHRFARARKHLDEATIVGKIAESPSHVLPDAKTTPDLSVFAWHFRKGLV